MYVSSQPVCCALRCIYNPAPILPSVAGAVDGTGLQLAETRNDAFDVILSLCRGTTGSYLVVI